MKKFAIAVLSLVMVIFCGVAFSGCGGNNFKLYYDEEWVPNFEYTLVRVDIYTESETQITVNLKSSDFAITVNGQKYTALFAISGSYISGQITETATEITKQCDCHAFVDFWLYFQNADLHGKNVRNLNLTYQNQKMSCFQDMIQ